jgi:hypothetical protein
MECLSSRQRADNSDRQEERMRNQHHILVLGCTLLLGHGIQAQTHDDKSVANPALRRELLERFEQDQAIRNEFIEKGVEHPDPSVIERMRVIGDADEERMKAIIHQYGWPGPTLVGRDGAQAAFMLVQHAGLALQKEALPLVEKAYKKKELPGESYALLLDRVLVREGKPQMYGTQTRPFEEWKGEEPVMEPIEDEGNVDKRRAKLGMVPLHDYQKILTMVYFPKDKDKP